MVLGALVAHWAQTALADAAVSLVISVIGGLTVRDPPTTTAWAVLRRNGPNHLGLWRDALPEHQMAVLTSDCVRDALPEHHMARITSECVPAI